MRRIHHFFLVGVAVILLVGLGGFLFVRQQFEAPPNRLSLDRAEGTIPFEWTEDDYGGVREPHSSMLITVRFGDQKKLFRMQFDLGAVSSVFYSGPLEAIAQRHGGVRIVEEGKRRYVENVTVTSGDLIVGFASARLVKTDSAAIDWEKDDAPLIGTLGSDLLEGRVLMIDYPGRSIRVLREVPAAVAHRSSSTFRYAQRRILLAAVFEGDDTQLMFDTGSSAFPLLTDEANWLRLSGGKNRRTFGVNSWGKTLTAHVADTPAHITLGGQVLPLRQVCYIEGTSAMQNLLMRLSGMGGMTGNKLFLDKLLILDARESRYWLLDRSPDRAPG